MLGDGNTQSFMLSTTGSGFCGDCTVLSGHIQLRYMDGSPANFSNGLFVHHILTSPVKSQPSFLSSCPAIGGAGFVGAGDDNGDKATAYAVPDGSFESGYWISPKDIFGATIVLVNYNPQPKQVQVWYDLEYLPGHVGSQVKSALISASCQPFGIKTSNAKAVNTTSVGMVFSEGGSIILAKGHLHDGGVAMHMEISRSGGGGPFRCTSKASYGSAIAGSHGAGTISSMSDCNTGPVKVSKGDKMTMISEYDLKSHSTRESTALVMGMFRIIFAPEKPWS